MRVRLYSAQILHPHGFVCVQDNCPQLSLSPATFTVAASAALNAAGITLATGTSTTAFNPYSSDLAFYIGAFIFEV